MSPDHSVSARARILAILAITALVLPPPEAFAFDGHSPSAPRSARVNSGSSPQNSSPTDSMARMPLVLPLFIQNHDFTSTVVMVNGSNQNTSAGVILTSLDGRTIAQKQVEFTPHSQRRVEVYSLLQSAVSPATTGRVTILHAPDPFSASVLASLSITYSGSAVPNYIDEETATPSPSGSQILRAAADDADGQPIVSLTSLARNPQHIQVQCLGEEKQHFSRTLELGPGETLVTAPCSNRPRQEVDFDSVFNVPDEEDPHFLGISLTSDAPPGSFAAFGLSPHRKDGGLFFSSVPFSDPKMAMSSNTVFAGVPIGSTPLLPGASYVPQISLVNFSNKPIQARINYALTSGETPSVNELAKLTLPPLTGRHLSFENLAGDPGLKNSFIVESGGSPGDLVAKLASANETSLHEVELLGKDQHDRQNGGSYPWSLENGNESTLLLFNHSDQPQYFNVAVGKDAELWAKAIQLQPMETRSISLRELIESQVKDDTGRTLPRTLKSGQISWFVPNPAAGSGRLLLSNPAIFMARNFSCSLTVVICAATGATFNISLASGDTQNFLGLSLVWCQPFSSGCSGVPNGSTGTASSYKWTTSAPAIVSMPGSSTSSSVSLYGAAVGSSQINETAYDGYGCSTGGGGPANVIKLQLQGNQYNSIFVGNDLNLAPPNSIFATVSPGGGTFTETSSVSGDTFAPVQSGGPGWVVTTTTQSTNPADRKLTVSYTVSGQGTVSQSLNVTARQFAYATNDSPSNNCTAGYGTDYLYTYTPYTHPDKTAVQSDLGLDGTAVTESFNPQPPSGTVTGNAILNANDQFTDHLTYCSNAPLTLSTSVTQTISIEGYQVRQNLLTYSSSGITLTNQGPTQ